MKHSRNDVHNGRPHPGRDTFVGRVSVAFAAVAAMTAVLAAVLVMAIWSYQFDAYVRGSLQKSADAVAASAGAAYTAFNGWAWGAHWVIPWYSATQETGVQIFDRAGKVVYSSIGADQMGTSGVLTAQEVEGAMEHRIAVTAPVLSGGKRVGTVRVLAAGRNALLDTRDLQFRRGSLLALGLTALVATLFASIAGAFYARRLVSPITRITATAQALRNGDSAARTEIRGEDEISVLGATLDAMAAAIEADRELERRLTADVAHELRTPLMAIQATVEAMQDGVLPADEEHLAVVHRETARLSRLADGILELTRLERGSVAFRTERLDVADPVRAALDAVEAIFESGDLTLVTELDEGIRVQGDADRLQQAVGNLLANAVRYTKPGGTVAVRVRRREDRAVIEVADTGVGIAADDLAHVFSRFWRADYARATASGGLGIGLAVTKEIVDRHHGTIEVESAPGDGTTFTITLPVVA